MFWSYVMQCKCKSMKKRSECSFICLFTMLETLQYQEIALEGVKCEDWKCTANCSQASFTRSLVSQVKKKITILLWAMENREMRIHNRHFLFYWFYWHALLYYHHTNIETVVTVVILESEWHFPPDCECTWCAGHVRPLCFPPHPACTQGWSPQWLAQMSEETHFIIGQYFVPTGDRLGLD